MARATAYYDRHAETMEVAERRRLEGETLRSVLGHAYHSVPAIRTLLDTAGVSPSRVTCLKDLECLPVLTRDRLIEEERKHPPFGAYLAKQISDVDVVYASPGPLYWPQGGEEWWERQRKCVSTSGMGSGDIAVVTMSYHLVPAGYLFHHALNHFGVTVIPAGTGNTELQVKVIRDLKVTGFAGFPSFLMILVQKALELGYDWKRDFSLKKALITGEVPSADTRRMWEDKYGISTLQVYGFVPPGLLAYECGEKNGMHVADGSLVEVVDPATGKQLGPGEKGEVVITITDPAFPLIRYGTGDLSSFTDEPCPCGRTSVRLMRILGRIGDASKVRGMFIHPKQVDDALSLVPEVLRWTMVVSKNNYRDEIMLRLETGHGEADRERLQPAVEKRLPELCHLRPDHIEFVSCGRIPDQEHKALLDHRKGRVAEV